MKYWLMAVSSDVEHVVQQFEDAGITLHPADLNAGASGPAPTSWLRDARDQRLDGRQAAATAGRRPAAGLDLGDAAGAVLDLGQDLVVGDQAAVADQRHAS